MLLRLAGRVEDWTLSFDDIVFVSTNTPSARLDVALKVIGYRQLGRFVDAAQFEAAVLHYVADQLDLPERLAGIGDRSSRTERVRQKEMACPHTLFHLLR